MAGCFCHFNGYEVKDAAARKSIVKTDSDLRDEIARLETEMRNSDVVTNARIDTFTALPQDATVNDAELADIRVAHDGVKYPTAGEAVRGQFRDLNDIVWTDRKAVKTAATAIGSVLDIAANTLGFPSYRHTIINCVEGESFELKGTGGSEARLYAWLDADDVMLGMAEDGEKHSDPIVIVAPAGAAKLIVNAVGSQTANVIRIDRVNGKINKRIPVYNSIEEMQAEFKESDGMCYVVNDNGYYCQGYKGNYYQFDKIKRFAEPELNNGGCAKLILPEFNPVKSNAECMEHILSIVDSYMGKGVQYVSSNGPFANSVSNLKGIQCSQFANAVIQGLKYEDSRLSSGILSENQFMDGGCKWLDIPDYVNTDGGCLSASELAHFAACHGWLHKTAFTKNVQPGDLVFFGQTGIYPGTDKQYDEVMWNGISHVAVCVARVGRKTLFVNAGAIAAISDENNNPLLSSDVYRKSENDAVNFQTILRDDKEYRITSFFMYGFARFPMNFRTLSDAENEIINTAIGN